MAQKKKPDDEFVDLEPTAFKLGSPGDTFDGTYLGAHSFSNDLGDGLFLSFADVAVTKANGDTEEHELGGIVAPGVLRRRFQNIPTGARVRVAEKEPIPPTKKGHDPTRDFRVQVDRATLERMKDTPQKPADPEDIPF